MRWMQGYPFYLLMGFAICLLLSILSFKYRKIPGRRYYWVISMLAAVTILTTVFEIMAFSFTAKLWWRNFQQAPLFFCGLFIYALVMDYIGRPIEKIQKQIKLLSIPIIIDVLFIYTDQFHHLLRSDIALVTVGGLSEITVKPTFLSMCFIVYNQMFTLFALFILAVNLRNTPKRYYKQHLMLFLALCTPILLIFLMPIIHVKVLGFTAVTFLPVMIIIYYILFRMELLSIWPLAKDKIFANLKDGIVLTDRYGVIVEINPAAEQLLALLSQNSQSNWMSKAMTPILQSQPKLLAQYNKHEETSIEIILPGEQGISYSATLIPIGDKVTHNAGMLFIFSDISDKKNYERELIHQAGIDELTGIYNRRFFLSKVKTQLEKPRFIVSLLLIDLDDFKSINDTYGHVAGDQILAAFAALMSKTYADRGIIGRFGGEEFALFLTGSDEQESLEEAERFRELVQDQVFIIYEETRIFLTVSMGIACANKPETTFEELYQQTDDALYVSKKTGKNKVTLQERLASR
jgi:diguanylate cyclase (GGDEF)-like protein